MAIMEISIVPVGTGTVSVSSYVADCIQKLRGAKVKHQLTAMGTIVEGGTEEIFQIALMVHQTPFEKGAQRVVTTIKIDDRRDIEATAERKVTVVEEDLRKRG
jgi:uncharacterized protein (TIGR00106 family)